MEDEGLSALRPAHPLGTDPLINKLVELEDEIQNASIMAPMMSLQEQEAARTEYVSLLKQVTALLDRARKRTDLRDHPTVRRMERYRVSPG